MDFWQKQRDKPLFPDLLWSRPENKKQAGKLLIIGGQSQEFSRVGASYQAAQKAGAGAIKVILPTSLSKLANMIPDVHFAPANKSGSFARTALAEWLDLSQWADHVLLAGDFGKNSETTTVLDSFLSKGQYRVTLSLGVVSSLGLSLAQLIQLPLTLVIDRSLLQKIGISLGLNVPIKSTTPTERLAEIIHQISQGNEANLVIQDEEQLWAASEGSVVSMNSKPIDNTKLAACCSIWLMQNPSKPLEALSIALYESQN